MLLQVARFPSFSCLDDIPLGVYVCVCVWCMHACVYLILYLLLCWWTAGSFPCVSCCENAAVSTWVQPRLQDRHLISFGCIPRGGVAELYGASTCDFWDPLYCFHSGYTRLNPRQACTRCPFLPRPHQHVSLVFFDETILADVRWYLIVALVCISLMTSDAELFLCGCWPFVYLLWEMSVQLLCSF